MRLNVGCMSARSYLVKVLKALPRVMLLHRHLMLLALLVVMSLQLILVALVLCVLVTELMLLL